MKYLTASALLGIAFSASATVYVVGPGESVPALNEGDVAYVTTENGSTWKCEGTAGGGTTCNRTSEATDQSKPWL